MGPSSPRRFEDKPPDECPPRPAPFPAPDDLNLSNAACCESMVAINVGVEKDTSSFSYAHFTKKKKKRDWIFYYLNDYFFWR